MEFVFFEQLLVILCAALLSAVLFSRVSLPPIIAYIAAGAFIGPHVLDLADPDRFTLIAEFGVVLLLFSLGLEFSLPRMLSLKGPVFGLGGAQVTVTTLVFAAAVYFWGASLESAIIIAGALALSSTAIVTKELASLQQFDSRYAQLSVAVLLFQDLVAVVFLILVPLFAGEGEGSMLSEFGFAFVKGLGLLVLLMGIGKWLLPKVYHEVARVRSEDVFVLSSLVIVLLAAWLTHVFHLSMALGAFIIGMMLGEGPFRHRIDAEIRPFKDVLLGLFFVTIGMSVDLDVVSEHGLRIALFTVALIAINVGLLALLARGMGETKGVALRLGLTLAQAGEFGLALLVLATLNGVVPVEQSSFVIAIAVLSMCASPLLIRHVDAIAEHGLRYWSTSPHEAQPSLPQVQLELEGHVIIGGFGRVGRTLAKLMRDNGISYIGIDNDADVVRRRRSDGDNVIFGDCSDLKILEQCELDRARLAILTFRSSEFAKQSVGRIRDIGIETPIIVRCYENADFEELISLGADRVVPEMLEGSLILGAQVLSLLGFEEAEINRQISHLRERTTL